MNARYGFRQRERDWYDAGGQMRGERATREFVDHMENYDRHRHGLYTIGPYDTYHGLTTVRGFHRFTVKYHGEVHPMFFRDPGEN